MLKFFEKIKFETYLAIIILLLLSLNSCKPKISNDYDTLYNLGVKNYNAKKFDKAIENFQKAIELNHTDPAVYYNLGGTYILTGQYDDAIENLQKAIDLDSEFSLAYSNMGYAYALKGDKTKSLKYFNKAKELDPELSEKIDEILIRFNKN